MEHEERERGIRIGIIGNPKLDNGRMPLVDENIPLPMVEIGVQPEFFINGVGYRTKERESSRGSRVLSKFALMAMAFSEMDPFTPRAKKHDTPKVDIVKEYGLIQQKKSHLSKSERDWVVHMFNQNYEQIK